MKSGKAIQFYPKTKQILTDGNLALKPKKTQNSTMLYEKPKMFILQPKKENKIFSGCWQVANQQDSC